MWNMQQERRRTGIDQLDIHICAKFPGLGGTAEAYGACRKLSEQRLAQFGAGSWLKTGPVAVRGVRNQRELRYEQQLAACIPEAQVHASGRISKNPVCKQAFGHADRLCLAIGSLDTHKNQQTGPDFSNLLPLDPDRGPFDPLQQSNQQSLFPRSR